MKNYTGWQWLLIDAANHYGMDKRTFEERIHWAESMLAQPAPYFEMKAPLAETKPLFIKAVQAIRKAQQRIPTGHRVGIDACCSGIQVMSALTGCIEGARSTGMVDPDVRADAYGRTTEVMNGILGGNFAISRKDAKRATMTAFYGSKETPKELFGEDTPELNAFYQAMLAIAPGAWELLQDLLKAWQPYALAHAWKLPDGFDARVKVMEKKEIRIEVDELDHATFTYEFYENKGTKRGISLPANVTHSVDAFVLREMHRRCNYERSVLEHAAGVIAYALASHAQGPLDPAAGRDTSDGKVGYYAQQYARSKMASAVILPYLDGVNVLLLSVEHLSALETMVNGMLAYQPFELVTIHDEFTAHANNINHVRWQYKEILADIADSNLLDDILSQIHGAPGQFKKLSAPGDLSTLIRQSNYALS